LGMNLTSNALLELQWYLFSGVFFLGAAYTLYHNGHVRVDVLYNGWSERRRAWMDLLGTLLFLLPFVALLLWVTAPTVWAAWRVREQYEPGWLSLHRFYPGVVAQVQKWLTADRLQPVIVTTKQERFVLALLAGVGVAWPQTWLYGKTVNQPKTTILQTLHQQYGVIGFVEDRLEALTAVQQVPALQDVPLFLATWGYNTPQQAQLATQKGIQPLTLAEFCDPHCPWLGHID